MNYPELRGTSGTPLPVANIDQFPRRWMNDTSRALEPVYRSTIVDTARATGAGYTVTARVDAAEMVAGHIMNTLDRLHRLEQAMAKADPIQADRYSGVIDDFTMVARYEFRGMPRMW